MCSFGIPDGCLRERAICWRLLLGYLPTKKEDWEDVLADKRALYQSFCRFVGGLIVMVVMGIMVGMVGMGVRMAWWG